MSRLSPHFVRREFACKCGCGLDTADVELIDVLEAVRTRFGRPIFINSGHRCVDHNRAIGGSPRSQHLHGRAADIVVSGVDPDLVQHWLEENYVGRFGIGRYNTFTHVDTRTKGPARWDLR